MTALDFCDTCGNKLLKDVKEQLGKLFSREEELPDNACGICFTSLLSTVPQQVEKTEKVEPAEGVIKTEPPDSDDDTDDGDGEYDASFEQEMDTEDKVIKPETDDSNEESPTSSRQAEIVNTSSAGLCPFINESKGTFDKGNKCREKVEEFLSKIGKIDGTPSCAHRELRAPRCEVFDLMGNITDADCPYQCAFCPANPFKSAFFLVRHSKIHTSVNKDLAAKPFQCGKCGATFKKIREWMRHTGERPFKCTHPECTRTFMFSSGLAEHVVKSHGGKKDEKKIGCKTCGEEFKYKKSLDQHIKIKHGGVGKGVKIKNLACRFCGWRFYNRGSLIVHESTHSDKKPFVCDQCDRGFYKKGSLKRHVRMHHKPGEVTHMYVCEVCGFSTKWQSSYHSHKLAHSKEYSHQCEQCGKRFKSISHLTNHRKYVHEGARPCKCRYCNKTFRYDGALNRHEVTHPEFRGVRKHVCHVCGRDCYKSTHLKEHMATHSNVKPYVCEVCDYRTTRQSSLMLHLKQHKGAKCFPCYYCDLRFVDYEECKDHRKFCRPTRPRGRHAVQGRSSSSTFSDIASASAAPDTLSLSASASTVLPDTLSVSASASTAPSAISVSAITSTVPPDALSLSANASTAPSTALEWPSESV